MKYIAPLAIAAGFYLALFEVPSANAQSADNLNPDPPQRTVDANGVDMASGTISVSKVMASGGDPNRPLNFALTFSSQPNNANILFAFNIGFSFSAFADSSYAEISSYGNPGMGSFSFKGGGTSTPPQGWSLGPGKRAIMVNGSLITSDGEQAVSIGGHYGVQYPDGETWTYYNSSDGTEPIKFIVSSRGYGIQIDYATITTPEIQFKMPSKVTFYNKSYVYCDETQLVACPAVSALNTFGTITYGGTLPGSGAAYLSRVVSTGVYDTPRAYRYLSSITMAAPGEQGVKISYGWGDDVVNGNGVGHVFTDILQLEAVGISHSSRSFQYVHAQQAGSSPDASGLYKSSDGTSFWTYAVPSPSTVYDGPFTTGVNYGPLAVRTLGVTNPIGGTTSTSSLSWLGAVTSRTDELGGVWTTSYDTNYRLTAATSPEGDKATYAYDDRGNPVEGRRIAKPGSGLADLVRTAGFPATCTNYLTCNKPIWTKDAKGQQTDITYNSNNGAVDTVTGPPDGNGVRPQKRYSYVQRYAWILGGSGGYVHASTPVWVLSNESHCLNSTATGNPAAPCVGNDEIKTTYDYGPDSGPNNLFLRGEAVTAGGATLRTCYVNDVNGRRLSVTKPRANLASCS